MAREGQTGARISIISNMNPRPFRQVKIVTPRYRAAADNIKVTRQSNKRPRLQVTVQPSEVIYDAGVRLDG